MLGGCHFESDFRCGMCDVVGKSFRLGWRIRCGGGGSSFVLFCEVQDEVRDGGSEAGGAMSSDENGKKSTSLEIILKVFIPRMVLNIYGRLPYFSP